MRFNDDEVWEVSVGKESFRLNGKQAGALKQASQEGKRGLVWFGDFAISIPHIIHIKRVISSKKLIGKKMEEFKSRIPKEALSR